MRAGVRTAIALLYTHHHELGRGCYYSRYTSCIIFTYIIIIFVVIVIIIITRFYRGYCERLQQQTSASRSSALSSPARRRRRRRRRCPARRFCHLRLLRRSHEDNGPRRRRRARQITRAHLLRFTVYKSIHTPPSPAAPICYNNIIPAVLVTSSYLCSTRHGYLLPLLA